MAFFLKEGTEGLIINRAKGFQRDFMRCFQAEGFVYWRLPESILEFQGLGSGFRL